MTCDNEGYVYVSGTWSYCIQVFDVFGNYIIKVGCLGSEIGQLSHPIDLSSSIRW